MKAAFTRKIITPSNMSVHDALHAVIFQKMGTSFENVAPLPTYGPSLYRALGDASPFATRRSWADEYLDMPFWDLQHLEGDGWWWSER